MVANQAPDWGWWKHVPTVTLREGIALSMNLDPARSRELLGSHARQEYEKRLALATRCLGDGLPAPENWAVVHYEGAEPVVRLKAFVTWALGVDWQIPAVLAELVGSGRQLVRSAELPATGDKHQPGLKESRPSAPDAFDVQLGWIALTDVLKIVGTGAWEAVSKAIQRGALRARCRADGITRDLKPLWLDFLVFDHPDEDVLWFDRENVWRARTRDASLEPVPNRASEIVLSLAQCRELWPEVAWPEAGHPTDEFAGGTDPLGHRVHPFIIGDPHTIFEWCMIYADRHPAVLKSNYDGATLRDKEFRLTLLGATGAGLRDAYGQPMGPPNDAEEQIRNEVYRELVRDIECGRIIPVRTAYCSDAPDVFDPTRCLVDIEPILAVARRRGDFGAAIAELLTAHPQLGDAAQTSKASQRKSRPGPISTGSSIQTAAERLFALGRVPGRTITWKKFQAALCREVGVKTDQRGYSLDTIQAAVRPLLLRIPNRENAESTEN